MTFEMTVDLLINPMSTVFPPGTGMMSSALMFAHMSKVSRASSGCGIGSRGST